MGELRPILVFTGVYDEPMRLKIEHSFKKAFDTLQLSGVIDLDEIPHITVNLCPRMRTNGGTASTSNRLIKLNYRLHLDNPSELDNTFLHELGHIVANIHYGRQCGHGWRWKKVMKIMGANDERCHKMDTAAYARPHKKHTYYCGCKAWELTTYRHKKVLKHMERTGRNYYHCPKCKKDLVQKVGEL